MDLFIFTADRSFDLTDIVADIIGPLCPRVRENIEKKNY